MKVRKIRKRDIQAALEARAARGDTLQDVGPYTIVMPSPERAAEAVAQLKTIFAPRTVLFPDREQHNEIS